MGLLKVESRLPNTPWLSQSEVPLLELSTADFKDIRGPHLFGPGPRGGGVPDVDLETLVPQGEHVHPCFPSQ